ncbi:hypothetical protein BE17_25120 [Sorangium cellulosum]|uniref:Secreted protein n=1 Tax=Sorangium cellulosum TaxID=56 RepID=A0A150SNK6_SORCE|nr:hypothetical protein BE17_25120 [Sorangium cellulosum]
MEITRLGTRIAALAALAWGSACGGNVVVDGMPDGSGGAGATSASANSASANSASATSASANSSGVTSSSASWMTTSAVTSSATGIGGGDTRSRCEAFCELFSETCGPVPQGCSRACDDQLGMAPQCNDLLLPFFDCAIGDVERCDVISARCAPLLDQYDMCASGDACGTLECSRGGDRTCHCKGSCQGIDFAAECRSGVAGVLCSCLVNGVEVAGCEDRGPACDVALGCCGPIFEEFR